ncbi:TonB family protein [Hymenobacter sp. BT770]|uniref:energy transducer TonB n=1 Tax=Hymenobacter sp. BT770 TaxID=2886942 RepID=UPI001D1134FE|nr:energy transducer TonB [Hymenobacter sp. BT770]MCC3155008.1 TonB family protein [Hymenobacter sp. BT770]MDO3416974.1 TonB family protein [Hymenobacter sp. BT770]
MFSLLTHGSLDDIVFEGRNQAYGAFQLRRSYQRHLGSALLIAVTACAVLFLLPLAIRYFLPEVVVAPPLFSGSEPAQPKIYELPKVKPVLPPAASHPAVTVTPHAEIKTHVVPDPEVKPTVESTLPQDVGKAGPVTPGAENSTGASAGNGPATAPGVDSAKPTVEPAPAPALTAEVMPDFVGGRSALQRYLQKHLRYPAAALAAQVSGKVYVTFVVQADGSIGDVVVLKGLGYGTEEAAARVVREMPAWTPGIQNHHSVPVRFTLPITFQYE